MSTATTQNGPATTTSVVSFVIPPTDDSVELYINLNADSVTGVRGSNAAREDKTIVIENLRGKEDSVTFDTAGFQYYHAPSAHKTFANDEEIKKEYYPESIELIKKFTGASRVEIFDHTVRRRVPGLIDDDVNKRQPVPNVHVDQTEKAATARVHRHLPAAEVSELLKKRFQIINLWRPISHPAWDWPLALCDYRSVNTSKNTVPISLIYPDTKGETLGIMYSENYRWKYLYGMTPDEMVLIKCSDTIRDSSVSVYTPHTAFEDPATPANSPHRQSIELRALVFYD